MGMLTRAFNAVRRFVVRAWEAARTTRINKSHFKHATGETANAALLADLVTLRNRCEYEAINNAIVFGVIETYCDDVLGEHGPTLNVQSSSPEYDAALEAVWAKWWAKPDVNQMMAGVDLLKMNVRQLWTAGEYLIQRTYDKSLIGEVSLRIQAIHARRLTTSAPMNDVVLGVRRTKQGKPFSYLIEQSDDVYSTGIYDEIPASQIIHAFSYLEPGQVRGVPWLASCLDPIAELRQFDAQVMDAARAAAAHGVLLYTDHKDIPFVQYNETTDLPRQTISMLPPGYKAHQIQPGQPAANYVDFRAERQREIGRPVGMPGMMVRLDSAKHSYSSARYDGNIYQRGIRCKQGWLHRTTLGPLIEDVAREAELLGLLPARPEDVTLTLTWPAIPMVDQNKEAQAITERQKNGTITCTAASAAFGGSFDRDIVIRKREAEKLRAAGLPVPWEQPAPAAAVGVKPAKPSDDEAEDDEEQEDEAEGKTDDK